MIGFVLRKMAASVGGNRQREMGNERERRGGSRGWGWKEKEMPLWFLRLPHWTATDDRRPDAGDAPLKDAV